MPRFIRSAESELRLDLHDLIENCVDAVADTMREAVDAGDYDGVADLAEQLGDVAREILRTACS